MNVAALFAEQVARRHGAPALLYGRGGRRRSIAFGALDARSARMAAHLRHHGIGAGSPVLVLQPISAELYAILLALLRIGAMPVFLDPSAGARHIDACCRALPPRALVATPKAHLLRFRSRGLARIPLRFSTGFPVPGARALSESAAWAPDWGVEAVDPAAPALLTFTSGTAGSPKGVVRSHGQLAAQFEALSPLIGKPGAVDLVTLPIFVLACLAGGSACVVPDMDLKRPDRVSAARLLETMSAHGVNRLISAPAVIERLLGALPAGDHPFAGLSHIMTGGGPVFLDLVRRLSAAAPGAAITAVYGSTEAEPIAYLSSADIGPADLIHSASGGGVLAGRIVPGARLEILPDRFGQPVGPLSAAAFAGLCLPPNRVGEIVVTGDSVVKTYWDKRQDPETKIAADGRVWHRTGDAGYRDLDGRLWLVGRCDARSVVARSTLYPFSVEAAARARVGARRVALSLIGGSRVVAVEGRAADAGKLVSALSWARVAGVVAVKRLPVDARHNSKIDHRRLAAMLRRKGGLMTDPGGASAARSPSDFRPGTLG